MPARARAAAILTAKIRAEAKPNLEQDYKKEQNKVASFYTLDSHKIAAYGIESR